MTGTTYRASVCRTACRSPAAAPARAATAAARRSIAVLVVVRLIIISDALSSYLGVTLLFKLPEKGRISAGALGKFLVDKGLVVNRRVIGNTSAGIAAPGAASAGAAATSTAASRASASATVAAAGGIIPAHKTALRLLSLSRLLRLVLGDKLCVSGLIGDL